MPRLGEFELIGRYFAPLAEAMPGAEGLTDDAFIGKMPPGRQIVLSTDALVAGVHFFDDMEPADIARRALRVNLSDLAAKGAVPFGYLLTLALPENTSEEWIAGFASGLALDQEEFGCPLLGGDTVRIPGPLVVSITVVGHVALHRAPRRSKAMPGDRILVSGTIGDAAFGLNLIRLVRGDDEYREISAEADMYLRGRYEQPFPRLELGQALSGSCLVRAMMDISDGLVGDLMRLAEASGIGAQLITSNVPYSEEAQEYMTCLLGNYVDAITGGDDYELLLTASPRHVAEIQEIGIDCGVRLTDIGFMTKEKGVIVYDRNGERIDFNKPGYRHF